MLSFVNLILDQLLISQTDVRVSFVSYGNGANVDFRLSQYNDRQSAKQRVSSINYLNQPSSNLASAIDTARSQVFLGSAGARSGVPWVAVVVTDRTPTTGTQQTVSAATQARLAGIQIIPVGVIVSGRLVRTILDQIALAQTRVTVVYDYNQLAGVASQVAGYVCNSHLSE